MQLELGKFYKTRDGRKVGPMRYHVDYASFVDWPWSGNDAILRTKAGVAGGSYGREHDLIEEWRDEPKSPIQEEVVMKRKLVYGEYGNLTIYESQGDLRIEFNKSKHTAEELEEASHILAQLAEFLKEESK